MELFKALTEKKFAEIKDHCENVIAEKVSEKIYEAKTSYLNTLRGIDENTEIIIKSDDGDKKKSKKDDDDKEDGDKKKKTFPFAKKADDSKNESKSEDLEVDEKDAPKKDKKKKVTTKDAGKFADADS